MQSNGVVVQKSSIRKLPNNNSKAVSKKFKHAFWLMMKTKEMRKENVLP